MRTSTGEATLGGEEPCLPQVASASAPQHWAGCSPLYLAGHMLTYSTRQAQQAPNCLRVQHKSKEDTEDGWIKGEQLTGAFLHTGGSKAVLPFRVDIHLVGGGVVQHQRWAGVFACGFVSEPVADLSQEGQHGWSRTCHPNERSPRPGILKSGRPVAALSV